MENDEFVAPVDAVHVEGVVGGVRARVADHDDDPATVRGPRQQESDLSQGQLVALVCLVPRLVVAVL